MRKTVEFAARRHPIDVATKSEKSPRERIVAAFKQDGISYCYWKSTRNLTRALSGPGDLDLLVAKADQHRAQQTLLREDFKIFPTVCGRDHPSITSFLAHNEMTGDIEHVHLHTLLITGEPLIRNDRIPWEDVVLGRAILHPTLAVRTLDPICESLILVVRACLELRRMDPVAARSWPSKADSFDRDRDALAKVVNRAELHETATALCGDAMADILCDAFFAPAPLSRQPLARRKVKTYFAVCRRYNAIEARGRALGRAALWLFGGANKALLHAARPCARRAPGGGIVVAVIGVDGSGKSTVTSSLRAWLSSEIDIMPIYFGTGDGRPSLALRPLKALVPLATRLLRRKPRGSSHGQVTDQAPGAGYAIMLTVWALAVAWEKRKKLTLARRAASRGLVVIADRYPQNEIEGLNDGPLLSRLCWTPRIFREIEARTYRLARRLPPDLVIRLKVAPETAAAREPEMSLPIIRQRIDEIGGLNFSGSRIVDIDAERPLAEVIRTAKRAVWNLL